MEQKTTTSVVNGRFWGSAAADWAAIQEHNCAPVYRATFDHVALRAMTDYADLGCGAGMAAQLAAERGSQVSGLDASEDLLAIARSRVPTGDFRVGELEHLPFPDASFDLVTGFNSFQYAANPSAALAEAKRVARRGAKVVIMTWGEPEGMEAASLVAALRPAAVSPTWCPWAFCSFGRTNTAKFRSWRRSGASNTFRCRFALAIPGSSYCLRSSGVAAKAIEHSSTGAVDEAHVRALTPFRQLDGSYKIAATFRCLITRA